MGSSRFSGRGSPSPTSRTWGSSRRSGRRPRGGVGSSVPHLPPAVARLSWVANNRTPETERLDNQLVGWLSLVNTANRGRREGPGEGRDVVPVDAHTRALPVAYSATDADTEALQHRAGDL